MLHKNHEINMTSSSGTISVNTDDLVSVLCRLIVIKSASTDTTYDFKITNNKNVIIYHKEGITNDLIDNIVLPMKSINTLTILNASTDELFTGVITFQEA